MILVILFPTVPEARVSAKEPARDPGGLEDAFGDLLARQIWGVSQNKGFIGHQYNNKDYSAQWSILGSSCLGILPFVRSTPGNPGDV